MFSAIDMFLAVIIVFVLTAFSCLFIAGAGTKNREDEVYENGYSKGFEDGMKVGGANDI